MTEHPHENQPEPGRRRSAPTSLRRSAPRAILADDTNALEC
jgi:hypothetical protein